MKHFKKFLQIDGTTQVEKYVVKQTKKKAPEKQVSVFDVYQSCLKSCQIQQNRV